jgi:arginyl-tRNA--protein-N-Asp/Glu arginylyltransferase
LVQADEENQVDDDDDDDDEIPAVVLVKKAVSGLETFINFFEQQNDVIYNNEDLRVFRKYLQVVREKEFNSKKQSTLDLFLNGCGME